MTTGHAHVRPIRSVRARLSKVASARETIAGFGHGMDVCGLTLGQFSLLDLVQATLEITGPADVVISTWSAGFYDLHAAERFRDCGMIRRIRFLMDSSAKRGQATVTDVTDVFGLESVRATRLHAKFALVGNDEWAVVVTTSMNLNLNPRCEQFEMTDDPERYTLFSGFVEEVWGELPPGDTGDRTLPWLRGMDAVAPALGIEVAPSIVMGRFDQ